MLRTAEQDLLASCHHYALGTCIKTDKLGLLRPASAVIPQVLAMSIAAGT